MAVVRPDEPLVSVYANTSGKIVIAQVPSQDYDLTVVVDPRDVADLCHALEVVAQEIEEAKCQPG